jgi:hypothetical protein
MSSSLDREVESSLVELREALDVARAAIAYDPQAATQAQRDQLAANLRMLAGLEERAAAKPEHAPLSSGLGADENLQQQPEEAAAEQDADISGYLGRDPNQPEEEEEEDFSDDDEMFAQFVQNYHESPATTPSKPPAPASAKPLTVVAPPAPISFVDDSSSSSSGNGGDFRPASPKSPGTEAGGGFVRAVSLHGVPVSPLPSRLSPTQATVPTGAVAEVTAR